MLEYETSHPEPLEGRSLKTEQHNSVVPRSYNHTLEWSDRSLDCCGFVCGRLRMYAVAFALARKSTARTP